MVVAVSSVALVAAVTGLGLFSAACRLIIRINSRRGFIHRGRFAPSRASILIVVVIIVTDLNACAASSFDLVGFVYRSAVAAGMVSA
jgi:hypothetical protein